MKNKLKDNIILHMCTANENHTMHGFWDMEGDRICSHFGPFFAFLPPNNPGNQNFEKNEKNVWRYHHFTGVP